MYKLYLNNTLETSSKNFIDIMILFLASLRLTSFSWDYFFNRIVLDDETIIQSSNASIEFWKDLIMDFKKAYNSNAHKIIEKYRDKQDILKEALLEANSILDI